MVQWLNWVWAKLFNTVGVLQNAIRCVKISWRERGRMGGWRRRASRRNDDGSPAAFFDNWIGFGQKPVVNPELAVQVAGEVYLDMENSRNSKP